MDVVGKYSDNKYGIVQELRSTFSNIKSINIDFSLIWFVCLSYVGLWVHTWTGYDKPTKKPTKNMVTWRVAAEFKSLLFPHTLYILLRASCLLNIGPIIDKKQGRERARQFVVAMLSLWILTALVPLAAAQVGFEQWVSDSPIEYENIKVEWSAPVPDWLQV